VGVIAFLVRKNRRGEVVISEPDGEQTRREQCEAVLQFFADHFGYVARPAISQDELIRLIDDGISPFDLTGTMIELLAQVPGEYLGETLVGGTFAPVLLPDTYRSRHVYIVGRSGSGKTTLVRNLILQDLEAGAGVGVIAPEHELLTEEILPFIPEHRWEDVIYVNPADETPVTFNPLRLDAGEDLDRKVDETLTALHRIFEEDGATGAPRMDTILRQALYTLIPTPGSTLADIEKLLDRADTRFRDSILAKIEDPEAERFWKQTYPAYPRDAHLSVVNRLGRFLRPAIVRRMLCGTGPSLNVRKAMDDGKILLFNLSDGVLGEANAELLGQLVVAKLQLAAMSRADISAEERRPFYLYIDEFQHFCGVAGRSYETMLSRARKYRLGLVLAHQQTGQIPEALLKEILGNVSTIVAFSLGAGDAKRIGREMIGEIGGEPTPLDTSELLSLSVGEAYAKIGRTVLFMKTNPPPVGPNPHAADEIIRRSRERWGVGRDIGHAPSTSVTPHPLESIDPGQVF
jgi:hypothetical protein